MRIGIATSDPRIAATVYRQMLMDTKAYKFQDYPDVAIYGSNLNDPQTVNGTGVYFHINERADKLKNLEIDVMVLPDISPSLLMDNDLLQNKISIQVPPQALPRLASEMFDGIEKNIEQLTRPNNTVLAEKYDNTMEAIQQWANFARIKEQQNGRGYQIKPHAESYRATELEKTLAGKKDSGNLVAISGGVTPQSTAEALIHSAFGEKSAIIAMSSAHTPNPVPKVMEIKKKNIGKLHPMFEEDPLPALLETTQMLASTMPSTLVTICNTMSIFQNEVEKKAKGVNVVDLVEETAKALPKNRPALFLGSEGTVAHEKYNDAIKKYRPDVDMIIPNKENQQKVNHALFNHILVGEFEAGGKILKEVIDSHKDTSEKLSIIGGCTEIGMGLRSLGDKHLNDEIIDSAFVGIDVAVKRANNTSIGR